MHNLNHTYKLCTTLPVEQDDLEWSNAMFAILFLAVKTACSSVLVSVTMLQCVTGYWQCKMYICTLCCQLCTMCWRLCIMLAVVYTVLATQIATK